MGCGGPFFVFCAMRVMTFAMGERVSQLIVCKCVYGFVVLGFAWVMVDDLDTRWVGSPG